MGSNRIVRGGRLLMLAAALAVLGWSRTTLADHSLGLSCLTCHSLKSGKVVAGSRNVFLDQVGQGRLYGWDKNTGLAPTNPTYWYCDGNSVSYGTNSLFWDPTPSGGSQPLDCSYCHDSPGDIPDQFEKAITAMGPSPYTGIGAAHPVANSLENRDWNAWTGAAGRDRILCNDCHYTDVTPRTPCSKDDTDGYPNHITSSLSGEPPSSLGNSYRARKDPKYAHLISTYSNVIGDWISTTAGALCFRCHDGTRATYMENISAIYNTAGGGLGGGHNVRYPGATGGILGSSKMPCHDCHDPHATNQNRKLIIQPAIGTGVLNPYDATANFAATGYSGSNDRIVCGGCHDGTKRVGGATVPSFLSTTAVVFPFHAGAHSSVAGSGNCLQKNNGCHQTAHDVDYYRCLDCHSQWAIGSNTALARVRHVGDEFGAVRLSTFTLSMGTNGWGFRLGTAGLGGVKSRHDIPYNDAGNMGIPANNGCLYCHNVAGAGAGMVRGDDTVVSPKREVTAITDLSPAYDDFCLACHDDSPSQFLGTYWAPQVARYYATAGHGRPSSSYRPVRYKDDRGNPAAATGCVECHVYHGSTAYKLLPGDVQTLLWATNPIAAGKVVKGFDYGLGSITGVRFPLGGASVSSKIDYKDYTDPDVNNRLGASYTFRSRYVSNYVTTWATYSQGSSPTAPKGEATDYGTSGDMRPGNTDSSGCGDTAQNATKIGFCNACHFATGGITTTTQGWVYTHEGNCGGAKTCVAPSAQEDLKAQKNFFKDCVECHDPHGSGTDNGTSESTANLGMIKGKVLANATISTSAAQTDSNWRSVSFLTTGSYVTADRTTSICTVCHTGAVPPERTPPGNCTAADDLKVDFAYRDGTPQPHQDGKNCTQCHRHGKTVDGTNREYTGFGRWGLCTGCHGLPPVSLLGLDRLLGTTDCNAALRSNIDARCENYPGGGGAHDKHVVFIDSKTTGAGLDQECTPCHGPDPGGATWHLECPIGTGFDWQIDFESWPSQCQNWVDIIDGAANLRANGVADSGRYYGGASGNAQTIRITTGAKGGEPQQCTNIDCHGAGAPYNAASSPTSLTTTKYFSRTSYPRNMRLLWDYEIGTLRPRITTIDQWARSIACAGCHGSRDTSTEPPTLIRVISTNANYMGTALPGVTASYFGPVSDYSLGGHGDPRINSTNDPSFVDSAPGQTTPMRCTDVCHDDQAPHFPAASANPYRLTTWSSASGSNIETGLCQRCHPATIYPGNGNHHPSYVGTTRGMPSHAIDMSPWSAQEIFVAPSSWLDVSGGAGLYEQNGYSASIVNGHTDRGIDFWGDRPGDATRSPPPMPVFYGQLAGPRATLPLERYVLGGGASNRVMCVTCHNPHGSDLYVFEGSLGTSAGAGKLISDTNMLRLRDSDNTLCDACH